MKFRTLMLFLLPCALIGVSFMVSFVGIFLEFSMADFLDETSRIIPYAILFVAALVLVGLTICREMTKYEVAAAASIYVAVQLIFHLALEAVSPHGFEFGIIYYFGFAYNQCFIDLVSEISGDASMSFLGVFSTYLFVLFGKNQEEQSE